MWLLVEGRVFMQAVKSGAERRKASLLDIDMRTRMIGKQFHSGCVKAILKRNK